MPTANSSLCSGRAEICATTLRPDWPALFAALHQPGALRVDLTAPAADITITADQAAYCTGITLTLGITGE